MFRVSTILDISGVVGDASDFYTDQGRERGHAVHIIAEQVFAKQDVTVNEAYHGYAEAVRAGAAALGVIPVCQERRFYDAHRGVNGRPDLVGYRLTPLGRIPAGPWIVDVKSGDPEDWHALQLGMYVILASADPAVRAALPEKYRDLPWQRIGLYVKETGRYKIVHYSDRANLQVCQSILDVVAWRHKYGLINGVGDGDRSEQPDDDPFTGDGGADPDSGRVVHGQDGRRPAPRG